MKSHIPLFSILAIFLFLWTPNGYGQSPSQEPISRILVKYKEGYNQVKTRMKFQSDLRVSRVKNLERLQVEVWDIDSWDKSTALTSNPEKLLQYLNNQPEIEFAEPDYPVYITDTEPNDPEFHQQWALKNTGQNACTPGNSIHASEAWDQRTDCGEIVVGVIDTGIDWTHPDLGDNIWQNLGEDANGNDCTLVWNGIRWELDPGDIDGIDSDGNFYTDDLIGWNFVNDNNLPMDYEGHGTHVAGVIGATGNNSKGVSGVCWNIQLMVLKGLDDAGRGQISDLCEALEYALMMGVKITNNSWSSLGNYSETLYYVIKTAGEAKDHLFIAAAGNNGSDNDQYPVYPASYDLPNILSVAASNCKDQPIAQSNYGVQSVDLYAPGEEIYSTLPGSSYGLKSGTSMAAPFVAGAAALIKAQFPNLTHENIKKKLAFNLRQAPSLVGKCRFSGTLDLHAAMEGGYLFKENDVPWEQFHSAIEWTDITEFKNQVWMSGAGKGLIQVDKETHEQTNYHAGNSTLPVNSVNGMTTMHGYLWLATYGGGVIRYDGNTFDSFSFFRDSTDYLVINSIAGDKEGNIWAATSSALVRFDGNHWEKVDTQENSNFGGGFQTLTVDSTGNVWLVSRLGLWFKERSSHSWVNLDSIVSTNNIFDVEVHPNGSVWISTDQGLFINSSGNWEQIESANGDVFDISFKNDSITWTRTDTGLFELKYGQPTINAIHPSIDGLKVWETGREGKYLDRFYIDSSGKIWLTFDSPEGGSACFQIYSDSNWYTYELSPDIDTYFNGENFLKSDPEGNIWVIGAQGFSKFNNNQWNNIEHKPYRVPADIAFDDQGAIWALYNFIEDSSQPELLICRQDTNCEVVEQSERILDAGMKLLLLSKTGTAWMSFAAGGRELIRYNGEWTVFDNSNVSLLPSNLGIESLFEDHLGQIWVGTTEGLFIFNDRFGQWHREPLSEVFPDNVSSNYFIHDIEQSPDSSIWAIVNGNFIQYKDEEWLIPDWTLRTEVYEFEIDQNGNLWAINGGSLYKISSKGNIIEWTQFNSPIQSSSIYNIEIDLFGQIWLKTESVNQVINASIQVINPDELTSFSVESFNACIGEEKFFENQTAVADSFQWLINQKLVSKERDMRHTFHLPGTYEVALLSYGGGEADTFISHIQVRALPDVGLGKDTTTCTRGVYLDPGDPSLAYAWTDLAGDTLSTDQGFIAKSTGDYIVTGTDVCGIVDKDTIQVTLTTDPAGSCVRPGDINGNGLVNMIDLLVLGSAHGERGKKRPNPSGEWKDQPSPDWGREFTHSSAIGLDLKHGDSDGDGQINILQDAAYIFEHAQGSHPPGITSASLANRLRVKPQRPRYFLGDTITFDVFLENAARKKVENAYGVAFSMEHNLQLSQAPVLCLHDSWLRNERDDLYGGFIKYPRHMDFGITRYNQQPKSDSGKIAEIEIVILAEDIDTTRYTQRLSFSVKALNTVLTDANGEQLPVDAINVNTLETVALEMPWVRVELKAILPGAYDPEKGGMYTHLNEQDLLPHIPPFPDVYQPEFASIPEDVVDWIWVQLRDKEDPHHVIAQRAAWLSKTGKVIDPEGEGSLVFMSPPGEYYIALKHRNHLEAISHRLVDLDTTQNDLASAYDFTTNPHLLLLDTPGEDPVYGLFPGDINQDGRIQYSGPGNERREILVRMGIEVRTQELIGYFPEDLNLDGKLDYREEGSDRAWMLKSVGAEDPTHIRFTKYPE